VGTVFFEAENLAGQLFLDVVQERVRFPRCGCRDSDLHKGVLTSMGPRSLGSRACVRHVEARRRRSVRNKRSGGRITRAAHPIARLASRQLSGIVMTTIAFRFVSIKHIHCAQCGRDEGKNQKALAADKRR